MKRAAIVLFVLAIAGCDSPATTAGSTLAVATTAQTSFTRVQRNGCYQDQDYQVSGEILISNVGAAPVVVPAVTDVVDGAHLGTVDCGRPFPITVAGGATLECSYGVDLPDGAYRTNAACVAGGPCATIPVDFAEPVIASTRE